MGGGGGHDRVGVNKDAAIEAWSHMHENVDRHFRFTGRNVKIAVIGLGVIPLTIYGLAKWSYKKWDPYGLHDGSSALRDATAAVAASASTDEE
ncbi:hypothetical protein RI367_002509 [Sorochytrium milnesiophthora]